MDIWPTPLQMHVNTAIREDMEDYYSICANTRYHRGWTLLNS